MPDYIKSIFPEGVTFHQNINYAGDTLKKHRLDLYLPANASKNSPLIIWVHGGAWFMNDKYADMGYMRKTIKRLLESGYALASIDYRHSTTASMPAQIQDCIQGVQYLHDHASTYGLNKNNFILMGFSAGGHLASLLALSQNNNVPAFLPAKTKSTFSIKAVLDFYGPSELLLFYGNATPGPDDSPIAKLLGVSPVLRPDLAKIASPLTYVDKSDPPFLIIHGEKDDQVPPVQSHLLKSYLDVLGVKNDLLIVKDAPHYGEAFDTEEVQERIFAFLRNLDSRK